jgi:formamidopyrimidine-DNA glycosylase
MPELPDLQAFSHTLSKKLPGKNVEKLHAINKKKLKISEAELRQAVEGASLSSVYREGKELHFSFDNGNVLALHLMLKGKLHLFQKNNAEKYSIIEMLFDDGSGLAMTDLQGQANATLNPAPRDAPDALSKTVNHKFLKTVLNKSRATVKKVLMDQDVIRGIGNAYADEILWHARISPFSISNRIPDAAVRKLASSIKSVLRQAEASILKANPEIISGEVRHFLAVHTRERQVSPTGKKIIVDESGSRRTYYTAEQKLYK